VDDRRPSATSYLGSVGFSGDLLVKYKNSGWLEPFGRGAYIRSGDKVDWPGALYTLQTQLGLPVHAGGKRRLNGKAMPITCRREKTGSFCMARGARPAGLVQGGSFRRRVCRDADKPFSRHSSGGIHRIHGEGVSVRISAPELAMLEMLHLVPIKSDSTRPVGHGKSGHPSAGGCAGIAGGLSLGQGEKLFLYMAENQGHAWLTKVDLSQVDLGRASGWSFRKAGLTPNIR